MNERNTGPNGFPTKIDDRGNLVEVIQDEDKEIGEWELILRRSDADIHGMYDELWNQVWRYRKLIREIREGKIDPEKVIGMDDFDWGMLQGRMSALAWVLGAEWEESLDT